ncbi:MAG: polysaccharide deacetylase family protein [Phycisphaerales bacterium]|nr:polysaccharide deacetylase family protein [Phycisphaerales bacterium]
MKDKTILLSFDVEEFDTPLRHRIRLTKDKQLHYGYLGLKNLFDLLQELQHPACTFYTTANFALHYPELICEIAQHHEIASHTFYHSSFKPADILNSKICLEEIINAPIYGFRMPNMKDFDKSLIGEAGYIYDSSINPTYLPGKYNYLAKPTKPYQESNYIEIPTSVVPIVRIPLFWLAFKNFPFNLYLNLCKMTLNRTGLLHIYFHPWEFADLSMFKIPSYIIKPNGQLLVDRLKQFIQYFLSKTDVHFEQTIDYINKNPSSFISKH